MKYLHYSARAGKPELADIESSLNYQGCCMAWRYQCTAVKLRRCHTSKENPGQ